MVRQSRKREKWLRITEIRKLGRGEHPEKIIEKESNKRGGIRQLMREREQSDASGVENTVYYLMERVIEEDWEIVCAAGEEGVVNGVIDAEKYLKQLLLAAEKVRESDVPYVFAGVRRAFIMCWDKIDKEVLSKRMSEEKEWALGTSLGEAAKSADVPVEEIERYIGVLSDRGKAAARAALLIGRDGKLSVVAYRYKQIFKDLEIEEIKRIEEEIEERDISDNEIIHFLIDATDGRAGAGLTKLLRKETVIIYQKAIPVEGMIEVLECIERRERRGKEEIAEIVNMIETEILSGMANILVKRREVTDIERNVVLVLEKRKYKDINVYLSRAEYLSYIEQIQTEDNNIREIEKIVYRMAECKKDSSPLINYIEKRDSKITKTAKKENSNLEWKDRIFCNSMNYLINRNSIRNVEESMDYAKYIRNEIAGTPLLSLVLIHLYRELGSTIVAECINHSYTPYSSVTVKEHINLVDKILNQIDNSLEKDRECASQYFLAILPLLPLQAQKSIFFNDKLNQIIWKKIISNYKIYEETLLKCIIGSSLLPHRLQDKKEYPLEDIHKVDEEMLCFLSMYFLTGRYTLQYLQIIDRSKLLQERNISIMPGRWECSEKDGIIAYKYTGIEQPSLSMVRISNQKANEKMDLIDPIFIFEEVKKKTLECVENKGLRDAAVHAIMGKFIDPKKEGLVGIKKLATDPYIKEMLILYMKKRIEYKVFKQVLPEIEAYLPGRKEKIQIPIPKTQRREREIPEYAKEITKEEDLKKEGVLLAQQAMARAENYVNPEQHPEQQRFSTWTVEEKEKVAECFFNELNRFWNVDKEKISKHFDGVVKYSTIFADTKQIMQAHNIFCAYLKFTNSPVEEFYPAAKAIITQYLEKMPVKQAATLPIIAGNSIILINTISEALNEIRKRDEDKCRYIVQYFIQEEESSIMIFSALKHLSENRTCEVYKNALDRALALIYSRDDNAVMYSLVFLEKEYLTAPDTEIGYTILMGAFRALSMRTKLDNAGVIALKIVQKAIFDNGYILSEQQKIDLLCTVKYDLYRYQDILLYFAADLPVEELLEIIIRINTPEARSARPAIREVIEKYIPEKREGIRIIMQMCAQAKIGSVVDRLFMIDLISKTADKYVQGAWNTLFLQIAEMLANETSPRVENALLALLQQILISSPSRKQLKEIYTEWKKKDKLQPLVKKMEKLFSRIREPEMQIY